MTGDVRGGGTDATVWVELVGDKRCSERMVLHSSAYNFTRGRTDEFVLRLAKLGALREVVVGASSISPLIGLSNLKSCSALESSLHQVSAASALFAESCWMQH